LWRRLKINIVSLNETQINLDLLHQSNTVVNNLFQDKDHFTIISYNKRELIGARQQGRVLTSIKGDYAKLITKAGSNSSGLGTWNWVKIQSEHRKILIMPAYQCVKLRQINNTVYN